MVSEILVDSRLSGHGVCHYRRNIAAGVTDTRRLYLLFQSVKPIHTFLYFCRRYGKNICDCQALLTAAGNSR